MEARSGDLREGRMGGHWVDPREGRSGDLREGRMGGHWVDPREGRMGGHWVDPREGRWVDRTEDRSEAQTEGRKGGHSEDPKEDRTGGRMGGHWEGLKAVHLAVLRVARQAVGWAARASAGSTTGQRRVRFRSSAAKPKEQVVVRPEGASTAGPLLGVLRPVRWTSTPVLMELEQAADQRSGVEQPGKLEQERFPASSTVGFVACPRLRW